MAQSTGYEPALSPVRLVNMALGSFGAGAIQSLDDTSPAAAKVRLKYFEVIRGLLGEYPWSFTQMTVQLQPVNEVPPDASNQLAEGWQHAYQLPPTCLSAPTKYLMNPRFAEYPMRRFEVQNQTLYCDESAVWAVGQFEVDPCNWPSYFVTAAVACLCAELIMPISGNAGILDAKRAEAWGTPQEKRMGGKLGLAKQIDARIKGPQAIRNFPLTDARWGEPFGI